MVRNSICLYPLGYPVTIDPARADHWTMPALEAARESWGGGEARFEASPLQIQIRARPGPAPVKSPPRFRSRPGWIQLICDASNRAAFVPSTRSARLVVSSGLLLDRDWFRRHLLEPLVLAALDRVYFTPLHAACVTGGGRSILLCGDSGAGKSTLTYACARRGWTFVADDAVHLTPFPENIVAAGSSVIRLREPARALFPGITKRTQRRRAQRENRHRDCAPQSGLCGLSIRESIASCVLVAKAGQSAASFVPGVSGARVFS